MAERADIEAALVEQLPNLRAFARTFHRDAARADDLVQEAMLKAWSSAASFKQGSNLKAWLFTILRNTFISETRKLRREVEDVDGVHAANLAEKPAHDDVIQFKDFRAALDQLPSDQREALILVGAAGFSYEEAAEICDCAVGTVKSRVNRARRRLSEMLDIEEGAPSLGDSVMIAATAGNGKALSA